VSSLGAARGVGTSDGKAALLSIAGTAAAEAFTAAGARLFRGTSRTAVALNSGFGEGGTGSSIRAIGGVTCGDGLSWDWPLPLGATACVAELTGRELSDANNQTTEIEDGNKTATSANTQGRDS
jgi:hypothetical protein